MITTIIIAIIVFLFLYILYKSIVNNKNYEEKQDKEHEYKDYEKGFVLESIK